MTVLRRRVGGNWYNIAGAPRVSRPPGRPKFTGASGGSGSVSVSWAAPLVAGSPVTGYVVAVTPGDVTVTLGPEARAATISSLANGVSYTLTVRAQSALGDGPQSAPAGPVTPTASGLVKRTVTNTGVLGVYDGALGRNLTYDDLTPHAGSLTLATPGATYRRVLFSSVPTVAADNVTFDQCLIRPPNISTYCVAWKAVAGAPPKGMRFVDTEIDGQGVDGPTGAAPSASLQPGINYSWLRVRTRRTKDGLKPQDNPEGGSILIEDSLFHENSFPAASHSDTLQIAGTGGHDVTVRGCTLDGYRGDLTPPIWASSSLMQWGSYPKNPDGSLKGVIRNILLEDCYVDGGSYASRIGQASTAVCQNVVIRRIKFGLNHQYGTITPGSGSLAADGGFVQVEDVTWDATGVTPYGQSVVAGQSVI